MLNSALRVLVLAVGLLAISFGQGADKPERTVRDNVITSLRDPELSVRLPPAAKYCGADRWVLYDIADCELHVFVGADPQGKVRRFYWVQFEQYLPTKPDLHHQYDSPRHTNIAGMDFYLDTTIAAGDDKSTPGSDGEHMRALVAQHGYKLPSERMYVRLVHLLDDAKRKELMIIYGEDLGPTGFSAADLRKVDGHMTDGPRLKKS